MTRSRAGRLLEAGGFAIMAVGCGLLAPIVGIGAAMSYASKGNDVAAFLCGVAGVCLVGIAALAALAAWEEWRR